MPYSAPFLFVDELTEINAKQIQGNYTYKPAEYFYQGHFKNNPITPAVILTETMAQIGLVCLGIYLLNQLETDFSDHRFAMSSCEMEFLGPVYPGEKVTVVSEKIYFRFNKLKCKVDMKNSNDDIVCSGTISGMILNKT